MLPVNDLITIAKARLDDARALNASSRFDGAIYLGGYAVEIALKVKICRTLAWTEFPSNRSEFQDYGSFKTHDLDVLLHLSGEEKKIKTLLLPEWSLFAQWNPELRYNPIGIATAQGALQLIQASEILVKVLC
jgi:hypothetical protein